MTQFLMISCDRPVPYGTCGTRDLFACPSLEYAHASARQDGWRQMPDGTWRCAVCSGTRR